MNRDFRTATDTELARDLERHRRAKQAMENHKRPPRSRGARIRDAIEHAKKKGRIMGPALKDLSTDETISVDALADNGNQSVYAKNNTASRQ